MIEQRQAETVVRTRGIPDQGPFGESLEETRAS